MGGSIRARRSGSGAWDSDAMSVIQSTDPDFRVCQIDLATLIELQVQAEERGWGTRWTPVDALRSQVSDGVVILQAFMRQKRAEDVRTYRCFVLFATVEGEAAGGVATIDVAPERYLTLARIDRDPEVREAFVRIFTLATGGIAMLAKV